MAEVRDERQRERAEAREGRRAHTDEPEQQRNASSLDLRRAAATAATAALVGALAGAAKAVADRRSSSAQRAKPEADDTSDDTHDEDEHPQSEAPQDDKEADEPEATQEPEEVTDDEQDEEEEQDDSQDDSEQTGASNGQIASIVVRAKEHVESVIGAEAESVSGVARANGNWHVNVEVVQMRRVPESTDILASYAVVLDGDGDLISVQEQRRYRRSQADDDR